MKISYEIPSVDVNVSNVIIPTQSGASDINLKIGKASALIEGDAVELISYTKHMFSEIKDFSTWMLAFMQSANNLNYSGDTSGSVSDERPVDED